MNYPELNNDIKERLHEGIVIPAHPLALNEEKNLDVKRQRALTRYYMASGAGGIAVGVHTTQFEIRQTGVDLLEPVLKLAAEETESAVSSPSPFVRIAGICGPVDQALQEAEIAVKHGYHLGLINMGGLESSSNEDLLDRTRQIAGIIPVFGFYLQPAVGGRILDYHFWKKFVTIPNVYAIKIAPFNRYHTLDVVRAVAESENREQIALYTGNDDNIVGDLLTTYRFLINGKAVEKRFVGGLLGQWAVWTSKAVELLEAVKKTGKIIPAEFMTYAAELTDANAAIFDAANRFKGCIPGIHEILRRQGLLEEIWSLNPEEKLSPGQKEEIDRIYEQYPHLHDDLFVKDNLKIFLDS